MLIRLLAGLALTLAAWALARTVAKAWRSPRLAAWVLDLAIPLAMFAAFLGVSGKPLFAGVSTFALIGGFAFADLGKREILKEPVVFTDMAELVELVKHPHLYLPFVGPGKVIAGAVAAAAGFVLLLAVEPPLWPLSPALCLAAAAAALGLVVGCSTVALAPAAALMRRFEVSGDPEADSAALGPLALQFVQGVPARAGRPAVRAAPSPLPAVAPLAETARPDIVLVQAESFFDPARLHPNLAGLLPEFAQLKAGGLQHGLMAAPTWGATTTRTEFEVLTGRPAESLGADRFNPYHQLARRPFESLASRLAQAGYRTICIHAHDRSFYGRDKVMPALGFELFAGEEAFAGAARRGRYVTDAEAAALAARLIAEAEGPAFVFIITMENHSPWVDEAGDRLPAAVPAEVARPGLARFLHGLAASDRMLAPLCETLSRRGEGVLALYGDHMPSLDLGAFTETATDYLIWRAGRVGAGQRRDLAAYDLASAVLAAAGLVEAAPAAADERAFVAA